MFVDLRTAEKLCLDTQQRFQAKTHEKKPLFVFVELNSCQRKSLWLLPYVFQPLNQGWIQDKDQKTSFWFIVGGIWLAALLLNLITVGENLRFCEKTRSFVNSDGSCYENTELRDRCLVVCVSWVNHKYIPIETLFIFRCYNFYEGGLAKSWLNFFIDVNSFCAGLTLEY